jgi:ketosteroid isomerase-like protein
VTTCGQWYFTRSKEGPSRHFPPVIHMPSFQRPGALVLAFGACLSATPLAAQSPRADSAAAVTAVDQFHAALAAGDSARAVSLLSNDILVLESGSIQNRTEYLSHHLGADMKAMQGSKGVRTVVRVTMLGDAAHVVSKTATPATNADGSNGSEMVELMLLSRAPAGWTIRAIHWSSRRRRAS